MNEERAIHADRSTVFCGARMGYAKTVQAGDFVFLSGHTAVGVDGTVGTGDIRAQTLLTFDKIKATLATVGCSMEDIVKTTVFLADSRDFLIMNQVFNDVFLTHAPVRTTVVAQPVLDTKIEIDVVAFKPRK